MLRMSYTYNKYVLHKCDLTKVRGGMGGSIISSAISHAPIGRRLSSLHTVQYRWEKRLGKIFENFLIEKSFDLLIFLQ